MKIVVDSYAWIKLFLGSEKGEKVKEILMKAEYAKVLTGDQHFKALPETIWLGS